MFTNLQSKTINVSLSFLHLGLQIIAAFWAVSIDRFQCQEQFIRNISYIGYVLVGINFLIYLCKSQVNTTPAINYLALGFNLLAAAAVFYLCIEGYNKYNKCGSVKALYEVFFFETVIAVLLFFLTMVAKAGWAERYANWPGNVAWAVLFLKTGFVSPYTIYAIVIGSMFAFISLAGLAAHCWTYNSLNFSGNNNKLSAHWLISVVFIIVSQLIALILAFTSSRDGEYDYQYCRKILIIFAGVNIVDLLFWFYIYQSMKNFRL